MLIATAFYPASSASSRNKVSRNPQQQSSASSSQAADEASALGENETALSSPGADLKAFGSKPFLRVLMPQAAPPPESIDTYEVINGVCTNTHKDNFNLGEQVCARVADAPLRAAAALRRVSFSGTDGTVANSADITTNPQTLLLTLPTTTTSVINGETVDNRGTWSASINSTASNAARAIAYFSVSAPNDAAADLVIYSVSTSDDTIQPGQATGFSLWIANNGPDAAQNVHVTQTAPPYMTFASATPGIGPAFTCSASGGIVDCAPAQSLAKGAISTFTINYTVSAGAPNAIVSTEVDITSTTNDPRTASNSSTTKVEIRANGTAPATCSVSCPSNITVTADTTQNNVSGAVVNFAGNIDSSGDCGTIQTSPASGSFFPVGPTTVNVSSSTGGGSCSFVVTVIDTAPPTITCPANIGVQAADGDCDATATVTTPATTGTGVTVSGVRSDGLALDAPYPAGTTTITWTATDSDDRRATCQQTVTVTVNDTQPPTITAPPDVNISTPPGTSGSCGLSVGETELGSPTTDDNCSASVKVVRTGVPSGNFFPIGTTTINYTATDGSGNTATAVQHVTVIDATPPLIAAPPDAAYTCPSEVPAANPSQATSGTILDGNGNPLPPQPPSDNCGTPTVTVTETRSGAGSASSPLIIKRVFTATDAAANSASSTQTITVIDNTPPTLTLNGANSLTVECHTPFTDPGASSSDNCSGTTTVTTTGTVNANTPGTYTLSYTATDAAGNTSGTATRTVTVVDTTPPTISLNGAGSLTVECHTSFTDPGATAIDGCAGSFAATANGSVNVNVPGTYTITYTASDPSSNAASPVARTVTVVDTTPPLISCTANITVSLPLNTVATSMVVNYQTPVATDSCSTTVNTTRTAGLPSGASFPVGTTTNTYTATDASGNTASCSFTVTVLYNFTGFFSPVSNPPTLNEAKGGQNIPLKFSLSGNKGLGIFAVGYPASQTVACATNTPINALEETDTPGNSTLSYEAGSDQYHYNWKTEKAWSGTCRLLVVKLNDGSTHTANFKFK
jgi:hypothetical protein